ncbi:MAG: tRNA (5-methylaminomethyl-2-thiouridine)(34)-methyltransferase MnmD [Candidatus Azobacteroides sp.]|nr:tRNA (5-methylaminomethyl-2-thiouridine)(34)-methyltransferase MnmD [Candidatus Azobacteroides sp.]
MQKFESEKEIILETTADGSLTLYVPDLDEHYHSMNGAVQESQHVYLAAGLSHYIQADKESKTEIQVLEFGFGTGLNAYLTALEAEKQKIKIRYIALEKVPLSQEITNQLNYLTANQSLFQQIHQSEWENPVAITPYFILQKLAIDFIAFDFPDCYDVVYYDAFAPDKQPEVWSRELFDKLFSAMKSGGVLTTYCAKGSIRRMMQQVGFTVERIPGAAGKREMLRAHVLRNPDSDKEKKE